MIACRRVERLEFSFPTYISCFDPSVSALRLDYSYAFVHSSIEAPQQGNYNVTINLRIGSVLCGLVLLVACVEPASIRASNTIISSYYFADMTNKPIINYSLHRVTGTGEIEGMVANLKLIVEHGTFTTFMIVISNSVHASVKS